MATRNDKRGGARTTSANAVGSNRQPVEEKNTEPLAFRHKPSVVEFYKELASAERRDFYDVIRLALEDHKAELEARAAEVHPTVFAKAS